MKIALNAMRPTPDGNHERYCFDEVSGEWRWFKFAGPMPRQVKNERVM